MKKRFNMIDLDCAHCAAKMEDAIKKLDGVKSASMNFIAQKLTIEAEEERFATLMPEVVAACKKVDADCDIEL